MSGNSRVLNRIRKFFFSDHEVIIENDGVQKPPVSTIVRNRENQRKGIVVPNDCHAIKVNYDQGGSAEYFKYSVFWDKYEIIETANEKVINIRFSNRLKNT